MKSILTVNDLSIQIGGRVLLKNVSFSINEGEAVLLSGPNGAGKSTLLKAILCLDTKGKTISGSIVVRDFGDVLRMDSVEVQRFRSSVAYIPQRDEYAEMGNIRVRDIISECGEAHNGKTLNFSEVNDLIDEWIPRKNDNSRVFDSKSRPGRFSGGEQRLLSVLSVIISRSDSNLLIIDEPLNNLDFVNARNISNVINRAIRNNPRMGVLMISHCRIFPFISREIQLTSDGILELPDHYVCHSCFGDHDENGYYSE